MMKRSFSSLLSLSPRATQSMSTTTLRIPVISYIPGLGDAVRSKLRNASCPASDLFRAGRLHLLDLPLPPPAGSSEPWPLNDEQILLLKEATVLLGDAHTCADVLLAGSDDIAPHEALFANLTWMQATYAGIDAIQKKIERERLAPPAFTLTRAGGIMPAAMAQYVFGWIVAVERKFFEAKEHQQRKDWNKTALDYRPFKELTVGILGVGDIGKEIGRMLALAGYQVLGFKRNVSGDDAGDTNYYTITDNLGRVLETCDFIVSVLPSTPATRDLLHEDNLVLCSKKKPVFINVGRGDVVSEAALVTALDKQWLSRAVLDVFAVEPLPQESPLWRHPRVHITPHVSAKSFPQDVADVFLRNLNHLLKHEPFEYKVNWAQGY